MLGMKNHFDISGSIEIREVDKAGVACNCNILIQLPMQIILPKTANKNSNSLLSYAT